MEISPSSIGEFITAITYALSQKNTKYYDGLLRRILESNSVATAKVQRSGDDFPSEIFFGRDNDKKSLLSKLMLGELRRTSSERTFRAKGLKHATRGLFDSPGSTSWLLSEMREKAERSFLARLDQEWYASIATEVGQVAKISEDEFYVPGSQGFIPTEKRGDSNKKHVKGSEREVEHSHDGQIAAMGSHNHPKSQRFSDLGGSGLKTEEAAGKVATKTTSSFLSDFADPSFFLSDFADPLPRPAAFPTHFSAFQISGCSGVGKTALVRAVYEDGSVGELFDLLVWAELEERELDLKHAARGLLKSTLGMPCSVDELDELDEMVRDALQGQRCLIVFDGIGTVSKDSWLHMKRCWFDFLDLGSKLVLITTPTTNPSEDVPDLVTYELPPLSPHNGWSLFSCIAYDTLGKEKGIVSPMAENIASFCGGIPLLLKLFGSLIRYDHSIRDIFLDVSLPASWDASSTILLCILALPPYLRQCLAYCALFPQGYVLNKEKMVDMWIANGLLKPSVLDISDGDACFHHLLCRSFFTDITTDQYNNVIEFRIPSLIHGIVEDVARVIYKEKLGLIGFMGEDAARISLAGEYEADHLQTLILSPTLHVGGNLDHSLVDFHQLCSLDLSCSGIRSLSGDICMLEELRYLNLSYTLIETLPDSIMNLSLLQTLDLSWCYHLKVLPKGLRSLTLMSRLDLSRCETLSYIPSGIGSLTSLTSMPLFVLGKKDHDSALLRELGPLNQLKGRLEIRNLETVGTITEAQNAKLDQKRLQHLELSWSQRDDDHCFKVFELLQPNQQLEVLGLRGYMGPEFPEWISTIKNLAKISITDCGCKKLPSLGQLPFLKELQLKGMTYLSYISSEFYGKGNADVVFPSLERIELYDLPSLLEWLGDKRAFPRLKFLTIEGCPQLSSFPRLPTLHDLIVSNSNKSILSSVSNPKSLLINGIELSAASYDHNFGAIKKFIFRNIPDKSIINLFSLAGSRTSLEHLGIHHCNELVHLHIREISSLKKLHIVDCRYLRMISMGDKDDGLPMLMEFVIEDCPQVSARDIYFHKLQSLSKLIARNCSDHFSIYHRDKKQLDKKRLDKKQKWLEKLRYLSINGCATLERELQDYPELVSHVPCVIVGNHKAPTLMY